MGARPVMLRPRCNQTRRRRVVCVNRRKPMSFCMTVAEPDPDAHAALAKFFEKNTEKEHEGTLV